MMSTPATSVLEYYEGSTDYGRIVVQYTTVPHIVSEAQSTTCSAGLQQPAGARTVSRTTSSDDSPFTNRLRKTGSAFWTSFGSIYWLRFHPLLPPPSGSLASQHQITSPFSQIQAAATTPSPSPSPPPADLMPAHAAVVVSADAVEA